MLFHSIVINLVQILYSMEHDFRNAGLLENTEYEMLPVFHCGNLDIINCNLCVIIFTMSENYWVKTKQVAKKPEIVNKTYRWSF